MSTTTTDVLLTRVRPGAFDIDPETMIAALAKLTLFAKIPSTVLAELIERVEYRVFLAGETIVTQGDHSTDLFVLMKGDAVVYKARESQSIELARLTKREFFGERSLLLGEPRSASVVASANYELAVLTKSNVHRIILEHPSVAELLAEALTTRTKESEQYLSTVHRSPEATTTTNVLAEIQRFFPIE